MQQTAMSRSARCRVLLAILIFGLALSPAKGQSPAKPQARNETSQKPASEQVFYVESWKKGPGKIREKTIHVEFHKQDETYNEIVEDETGAPKYRLVIQPIHQWYKPGTSKTRLVGWGIDLDQGEDRGVNSLLRIGRGQGDNFPREDVIGWLNPEENPGIQTGSYGYPLSAKRVIKVESFYCIIQVKGYRLLSKRKEILWYKQKGFSWISIDIDFKNSYDGPRDNK